MPAYNKVILKNSSVAGAIPQPAFLEYGEFALNYTDGLLFYKNNDNQIKIYGQDDSSVMSTPNTVVKRDEYGSINVTSLNTVPTESCPYVGVYAKSINTFGALSDTINGDYSHGFQGNGQLKLAVDKTIGKLVWFNRITNNSASMDVPVVSLSPAATTGQLYNINLPKRSGTIAIADTVDGFINTNSIVGLRNELDNIGLDIATLQLAISETPEFYPTGKTIFVDSIVGNDSRGQLSKYAEAFPFKTIEAAVNASSGDTIEVNGTIFVRSGNIVNVNLENHGLLNGRKITVTGNGQASFNVSEAEISVIDADNFRYSTVTSGTATGSGTTTITPIGGTDIIYVRNGNYTVPNQISLDGKGNIYFEPSVNITVTATTAFILTTNEVKTITGYANFNVLNSSGVLSQTSGSITLEYSGITGTSTGTLFAISGGTLNTSFASIVTSDANVFALTGSSSLVIRRSHTTTCNQFLNCNTSGDITIDQWTVVGKSTDSTIRVVNAGGFSYRGVNFNNNSATGRCITFAYSTVGPGPVLRNLRLQTAGVPIVCENNGTFRDVFLDSVKLNTLTSTNPSVQSSNKTTTLYSTSTYSNVSPHSSIIIDGQYNIMTKIF
jgi:hypothetical protein